MEISFYTQLNNNLIQALNQNVASILSQEETFLPPLINPLAGMPITDANFFNLMLSNNLNGTNFTEFVKVGEALSKGIDVFSNTQGNKPGGIICQEDGMSANPGYSFMLPVQGGIQGSIRFGPQNGMQNNYVPFQSNNASMSDFGNFLQEQFANAINASLTGCPFKLNVPENGMDQFKEKLIDAISKDPSFVAATANRAQQMVNDFQRLPFDRGSFIEKARDVNSNEFKQLTSALTEHITNMSQNGQKSFNPEFDKLSRPLVINIQVNLGNTGQNKEQEQTKMPAQKTAQAASAGSAAKTQTQAKKPAQRKEQSAAAAKAAPKQTQAKAPTQKKEQSAAASKTAPKQTQAKKPAPQKEQAASAETAAQKKTPAKQPAQKKESASASKAEPKQTQAKKPTQKKEQAASTGSAAKTQSRAKKTVQNEQSASVGSAAQNQKPDTEKAVANFVKENLKQDKSAATLANTFVGTAIEKARQVVQSDARIPVGLALACSVMNPVITGSFTPRDFVKIADNIVSLQELKGDKDLRKARDSGDTNSFKSGLEKVIRDAPVMLEKAISQLTGSTQQKTQTRSQSLSTGSRR